MSLLHGDELQMSYACGAGFHLGGEANLLTDAFITANHASIATFRAAIGSITPAHAELKSTLGRFQRAVDYDGATFGIGDVTDSNLPSTNTNTALVNLTQAAGTSGLVLPLE